MLARRRHAGAARRQPAAEPDAEVSFVTRDLARASAAHASIAASVARRRDRDACATTANSTGGNATHYAVPGLPGNAQLAYAATGDSPVSTFTRASSHASCRRTSRCCRRPARRPAGGSPTKSSSQSRRATRSAASCATLVRRRTRSKPIAAVLGPCGRDGGAEGRPEAPRADLTAARARPQPVRVILDERHARSRLSSRCPTWANTFRSTCRAPNTDRDCQQQHRRRRG